MRCTRRLIPLLWLAALLGGCLAVRDRQPAKVVIEDAHGSGSRVAFNPTGTLLASGGKGGDVRLWRLPHGTGLAAWTAHQDQVNGLVFLADGQRLLTAGYDGLIAEWDLTGRQIRGRRADSPIRHMIADEDRGLVFSGHADGTVRRWNLAELTPTARQPVHNGAVRALAWHAATGKVASSGTDGRVFIWRPGEQPETLQHSGGDLRTLTFSRDGRRLFGAGWFSLARWDLDTGTRRSLPTEHGGIINSIQFAPDGSYLASISRQTDSAVLLLDPETGATLTRLQSHDLCGSDVRVSARGRYIATTSDDASVRIWDMNNPLPAN